MNGKKIIEILLVEDSLDDADLTIRALKKKNLANNLLHLEDGAEALNFIFSPEGLNMPKLSGIQVLKELKSDERTKAIPVVVLTSSKEEPDIKECYTLGVNSYIVKPVEFDGFLNAVSELGMYWLLLNQPPQ